MGSEWIVMDFLGINEFYLKFNVKVNYCSDRPK